MKPLLLFLVIFAATTAHALLPEGVFAERFAAGLGFPVSMAITPDNTVVLVTEKSGAVRIIVDGVLLPDPVVSVTPRLTNEAGLHGIELMPDFEQTGYFLITYTPAADLDHIFMSRVRLNADGSGVLVDDPWYTLPSRPGTDRQLARFSVSQVSIPKSRAALSPRI